MGGGTVRLQRRMAASLQGRRIVITRAREQAGDLVRSLEARGAVTVIAPVIRIQPLENLGALRPSAGDARQVLSTTLRQHGAEVETTAVYRTVPVQSDLSALAADIKGGRIDAVTFTSSSTVRSFVDLVGPASTSGGFVAATIGPVTAGTARELGLRDILEADPHTVQGLVDALARRFA